MAVNDPCPTSEQLRDFVSGQLSGDQLHRIGLHLVRCSQCQLAVSQETNASTSGTSNATQPPQPAEAVTKTPQSTRRAFAPTLMGLNALGLAATLLAGYLAYSYWFRTPAEPGDAAPASSGFSSLDQPLQATDEGLTPSQPRITTDPSVESGEAPSGIFPLENFRADEPIESIKVSISTGKGEPLAESLDMHLGFGFPLRLRVSRSPPNEIGFAAFPQTSSLAPSSPGLEPEKTEWFQFQANPEAEGLDELLRTPQLLTGLKVEDISQIGFASSSEADWILDSYRIEINGKLFAEHQQLAASSKEHRQAYGEFLEDQFSTHAAFVQLASQAQATPAASNSPEEANQELQDAVVTSAVPSNVFAGVLGGTHPWFGDPQFAPIGWSEQFVRSISVRLLTGDEDYTGSRNPLFLVCRGKKYLLSHDYDPLQGEQTWQRFNLTADELVASPIFRRDLATIGLGMLGSSFDLALTPDRSNIRRIVVEAEGELIYDSLQSEEDTRRLEQIWLVPPAHYGQEGTVVRNTLSPIERHLWLQGEAVADLTSYPKKPTDPEKQIPVATPVPAAPPPQVLANDGTTLGTGTNGLGSSVPSSFAGAIAPSLRGQRNNWGSLKPSAIPVLNRVLPTSNKPSSRPISQTPPPSRPGISEVRIENGGRVLHDQSNVKVQWRVRGEAKQITRFRVDLFAVFPHRLLPTFFPAITASDASSPIAIFSATDIRYESELPLKIDSLLAVPDGMRPTGNELLQMYLQPRVTAYAADGSVLATGLDSTLLPAFPAANAYPSQQPLGSLLPAGEYEVGDSNGQWTKQQFVAEGERTPAAAAWKLTSPQSSQHAMNFGSRASTSPSSPATGMSPPQVQNVALRSTGANAPLRAQWTGSAPLESSLRVISHLGFIHGVRQAKNDFSVELSLELTTENPKQRIEIKSLRPISFNKLKNNGDPAPLLLVDVPIALGATMADPRELDTSLYSYSSDNDKPLVAAREAKISLALTLRQAQVHTDPQTRLSEAIGVFGTRVVPQPASVTKVPSRGGTFSIFCHGTGGHRNGRDEELITEFGAAFWGRGADDSSNAFYQREYQQSFLILDGVGTTDMDDTSGATIGLATDNVPNHPMPGDFDPVSLDKKPLKPTGTSETSGNRVSGMHVSKLPIPDQLRRLPGIQDLNKAHRGTIHGDGWDDNVAHAVFVLKELQGKGKLPRTINMIGWSRGAVTCIKLSNAIHDYFVLGKPFLIPQDYTQGRARSNLVELIPALPISELVDASDISLNLFLIDPVPGRFGVSGKSWNSDRDSETFPPDEMDYQQLPPITKRCVVTLANDEQRQGFAPLDIDDLQIANPNSQVVFLPFPGIHRTQLRLKPRDPTTVIAGVEKPELTAVPNVVWDLAWRFMNLEGAKMERDLLARSPLGGPLSAQQVVEAFSDMWLRKEQYHAIRNSGPMQWAQGFFGPRLYTGYPAAWASSKTTFTTFLSGLMKNPAQISKIAKSGFDLSSIQTLTREKHAREDLFTSELGVYTFAPGFFINEYHRACFEKSYPKLYAYLSNPQGKAGTLPSEAVQELSTIADSSQLWKMLSQLGLSMSGSQFQTSNAFRFGERLGQPLRDGKAPLVSKVQMGVMSDMGLLPDLGLSKKSSSNTPTTVMPIDLTPRPVPDILGLSNSDAVAKLKSRTFKAQPSPQQPGPKHIVTRIITQIGGRNIIPENDVLPPQSTVQYALAESAAVPDIAGKSNQEAEQLLKQAGFKARPFPDNPHPQMSVTAYLTKVGSQVVKPGDHMPLGSVLDYRMNFPPLKLQTSKQRAVRRFRLTDVGRKPGQFFLEVKPDRKKVTKTLFYSPLIELIIGTKAQRTDIVDGIVHRIPATGYWKVSNGETVAVDMPIQFQKNVKVILREKAPSFFFGLPLEQSITSWDVSMENSPLVTYQVLGKVFVASGETYTARIDNNKYADFSFEVGDFGSKQP